MARSSATPLGAVVRGALAGAAGIAAMDALLFARYRRGGGTDRFVDWEFSANLKDWDGASAPAQVGKRVVEGLLQRPLPPERAALTNNVVHWAYGLAWGTGYGVAAGSLAVPKVGFGLAFGPVVWTSGYVVLPVAGLYQPIWKYDLKTLGKDLSAHVVYGMTTAAVFRILSRR